MKNNTQSKTSTPSPPYASNLATDEEMAKLALQVRANPVLWFEAFGRILDKSGQIVMPVANEYQRKIAIAYLKARELGIPARQVQLKPRQKGSSTWDVGMSYTHLRNFRTSACFMGNKEKTTGNLMAMLKRYNDSDKFPWGNQGKVTAEGAKWTHDSKVVSETAGGSDPGRSGTYQLLLLSEVAYWAGDGVRSADIILDGILKCVPFLADTLIIMESTPNGAAGAFYERYQDGIPFEDFMSGKRTDGYVRIFSPWFEFADSEDKLTDEAKERVMGSLTSEEEDFWQENGL